MLLLLPHCLAVGTDGLAGKRQGIGPETRHGVTARPLLAATGVALPESRCNGSDGHGAC